MYAFLYWIYSLCCCHKQKWFPDFHVKWLTAPVNECSHCMYRQLIVVMFLWEENSLLYSLDSVSCQSYSVYCSSDLWVKTCLFPSNLGNFDFFLTSLLWVLLCSVGYNWQKCVSISCSWTQGKLKDVNCRVLHKGIFLVWNSFFSI